MRGSEPPGALLIGAGHAHLHAIREAAEFRRRGHKLTVIAPGPFWYSGIATGMVGGRYAPDLDCIDVAAMAERSGARFLQDRLIGLDAQAGLAILERHGRLPYDAISLNLGSEAPRMPGDDGPLIYSAKPIHGLVQLRDELRARLGRAGAPLRVVVAGAGPTGCEIAGNIAALATRAGSPRPQIAVLAGGTRVLRQLPARASAEVRRNLRARGVSFQTRSRVTRVEHGRALLDNGGEVPFDMFINATGLEPAPVLRKLGLPLSRDGALTVDGFLRSPTDPRIHGGGDCVAVQGHNLPRIGVYAIRQGPVLLHNLLASLDSGRPRTFVPQRSYLWIMNLGDGSGLAARGRLWWHGRSAFWLKDRIDHRFLRSFRPD